MDIINNFLKEQIELLNKEKNIEAYDNYENFHDDIEGIFLDKSINKSYKQKLINQYNEVLFKTCLLYLSKKNIDLFMLTKELNHNNLIKKFNSSIIKNDFNHSPFKLTDKWIKNLPDEIKTVFETKNINFKQRLPIFFGIALDQKNTLFCDIIIRNNIQKGEHVNYFKFLNKQYNPEHFIKEDDINIIKVSINSIADSLLASEAFNFKYLIKEKYECPNIIETLIKRKSINKENLFDFLYWEDKKNNILKPSPNFEHIIINLFPEAEELVKQPAFKKILKEYKYKKDQNNNLTYDKLKSLYEAELIKNSVQENKIKKRSNHI